MTTNEKIKKKLEKFLEKKNLSSIKVSVEDRIVTIAGLADTWDDVVQIGHYAGSLKGVRGIVNNTKSRDITERKDEAQSFFRDSGIRMKLPGKTDVVIIGAGVIGCFVARELSRYNLDVVVVEKESDVACGATKANNGQIHTGVGEKSGTLKKELCAEAWPLYQKIAEDLDVPYEKNGLLILLTEESLPQWVPSFLSRIILTYIVPYFVAHRGKSVGDTPRVVNRKELLQMEPHITKRAVKAILMPGYGVTCPYKITIALAENAVENGVTFVLDTEVLDIMVENDAVRKVATSRGDISCRTVINAAGVYADVIAGMAGAREYTIHPRKGSILLFDKTEGYLTHQVSELRFPQDPHTKGGGVLETVDGNMLWGPTAVEVSDREDTSVSKSELETMVEKYHPAVPEFPLNSVITYFAGVRAATYTEDFVIGPSRVRGFIHAAGIQSPGLTAAPVIAKRVVDILRKSGVPLKEKEGFNPVRKAPPVFKELSAEEKTELIKKNSRYGHIVCRCEQVTEAEIVNAIHGSIPAVTMDAVKRRTRAGMGRCQGGFCGPRVAEILSREQGLPLERVTKKGGGSYIVASKTKVVS
ncbi:MAG: FAD/NAD(P)-binding oxidoreductase [Theionarchaea archaeon]|nr:FAD/NAD(P)-binding oxidoreductase [Theionarchaea archaeon]MBU7037996.1 FAD/NAD(P)-binding oxidoreductase [Theionarchaea archaeon]